MISIVMTMITMCNGDGDMMTRRIKIAATTNDDNDNVDDGDGHN